MQRVRLIHWKEAEAGEAISRLRSAGYRIEFDPISQNLLKLIRSDPPDAIVIDLSRLPSQGRDLGIGFRQFKATRGIPLIFAAGDPGKIAGIRKLLPDAVYCEWDDIGASLKKALFSPPENPVIPGSIMAGYAGRPLPKKLGIKTGCTAVLIDAPPNFEETLGELPEKVIVRRDRPESADLIIWFTTSTADLEVRIKTMGDLLGKKASMWIAWPKKSSGKAGDLTQQDVRRIGLASGLVDYKICSIDFTWSGLLFTRRKPK
jgi:hypothetical protein